MRMIWLDMDGNFIDLYGVNGWLEDIINHNVRPYEVARPLVRMCELARVLNKLQAKGYEIGIVSWLAKGSNEEYDREVAKVKKEWLAKHLPSVRFDHIEILAYGVPKSSVGGGYLFDDEEPNRNEWKGIAYGNWELLPRLKELAK